MTSSQNPNDANRYAEQFDGMAPTDAEAALIAEGVGDGTETDTPEVPEVPETPEVPEAPVAAAPAAPTAPTAPAAQDFAARAKAIEDEYEAGDLTPVTLNQKMRELTLEEVDYKNAVANYERELAAYNATVEAAVATAKNDWNAAALAFERAHADFMANPLRAEAMQRAISLVESAAAAKGEALTHEQILDRAYGSAREAFNYTAPAAVDTKEAVGKALADRKQATPARTLGDAPQAHVESLRGTATFESLDALGIEDLEATFANMSPAQQDAYLRAAEGATSHGRE